MFVASAEEILTWAGIPRRAEAGLIGFQRTEDPGRVARAKEYFRQPQNQSPTALIVGLHQAPGQSLYNVEMSDGAIDSGGSAVLEILTDTAKLDESTVAAIVREQTITRIAESVTDDVPGVGDSGADAEVGLDSEDPYDVEHAGQPEEPTDETDDEQVEDEQVEEIELGQSVLSELVSRLDDPGWVSQNITDLRDLAKPGTVIDGQHRVIGAAQLERNLPFAVIAMVDCPWAEQVFQFTVVNYTAKGIPDQFITANAALSLTASELDYLQDRLQQAGVKVTEYELMRVVNFDARSPFYELVNLSERPSAGLIGYKTMVRVAKAWYSARDPLFSLLLPNLYPEIRGRSGAAKRERLHQWKNEDWGEFFLIFWRSVYDRYGHEPSHQAGYTLWDVGHSQLLVAVVLQQLQAAFLSNLRAQDEDFFQVQADTNEEARRQMLTKIQRRAEKVMDSIPAAFFATEWQTKGLNIGPGRVALESAFAQLIDSKGRYQFSKSALVTGKAD